MSKDSRQLIDGRNRMRACQELDIEPNADELDADCDPWRYVIDRNLHRRHLDASQRALVAQKMANLKLGHNQFSTVGPQNCEPMPERKAAVIMNVSSRLVSSARVVQREGSEELQQAVERGEVPVSRAATIAREVPKERQLEAAKAQPKPKNAKAVPVEKTADIDQNLILEKVADGVPVGTSLNDLQDELYDKMRSALAVLSRWPSGFESLQCQIIDEVLAEHFAPTND